jgi:cytochrome c556
MGRVRVSIVFEFGARIGHLLTFGASMKRVRILLRMLTIVLVGLRFAWAHEGATGITKERMDAMESMSKAMKAIRRYVEGNRNIAAIKDEADRIRELAGRIPQWFPPGSDTKPTDALAAIWQHWPDFQARAAQLEQQSAKLAAVAASGDLRSIAAQFRAVGQSCSACHADYRQKP